MLVPLYGFLQGDSLGLVVLAQDHQTIAQLGADVQRAACMRVQPRRQSRVFSGGRELDPGSTVAAAGLSALDRIDVTAFGEPDEPA